MLLSTPTNSHVSFRRSHHRPQRTPEPIPCRDSPMLTPSPLRRRPLFPQNDISDDINPGFLHSPFQSPPNVQHLYSSYTARPEPIAADDTEGAIFLDSPTTTASRPMPTSLAQPLRTATKRPALSVMQLNSPSTAFVGAGTKRKSTPLVSTPLRRHNLTPLSIHSAQHPTSDIVALDRLAPLPPPKFLAKTPPTKAETDCHLRSQTATLTRLRITDLDGSGDEMDRQTVDSGCDISDDDDQIGNVFLAGSIPRPPVSPEVLVTKGNKQEEEVAAISPGGHITKRRARSRPVSEELLESVYRSPSSDHKKPVEIKRPAPSGPIPFPSNRMHRRNGSASSSSDMGSPLPRRRTSAGPSRPPKTLHPISLPRPGPRPLNRVESATLFFGPPIPAPSQQPPLRARTSSTVLTSTSSSQLAAKKPKATNRHSYAGPGQAHIWNTIRTDNNTPSPHSSPVVDVDAGNSSRDIDMEEELFFGTESGNEFGGLGPSNSSFVFSITEGTPSPRAKQQPQTLPKKYRPRDSGIVVSDDDDYDDRHNLPGSLLSVMPRASTSVNSIDSDADEGLITPGVGPGQFSGWPEAAVRINDSSTSIEGMLTASDADAFILRTLTAVTKRLKGGPSAGADGEGKRPPGTPVKRIKTTYLNGDRPWQSAVTHKVANIDFDYGHGFGLAKDGGKKGKGKPRQSLPALPLTSGLKQWNASCKLPSNGTGSDTDEEEDSPSGKERGRAAMYDGLGLGRPVKVPDVDRPASAVSRTRWLMRRSSSGAFSFSSGSDSSRDATPTRTTLTHGQSSLPRVPIQYSPSKNALKLSSLRSTSGSSSSSASSLNSPSIRQLPIGAASSRARKNSRPSIPLPHSTVDETRRGPRSSSTHRLSAGAHPYGSRLPRSRLSDSFAYEQPGRFERDFVELDEIGSGEFGKVIKVRKKHDPESGRYAIKKSKRFEGVRHRLRLREEVDTLQHLSRIAASGGTEVRHPNVLGYVDSWEEGEALYIQTELCELGNLSHFLWEYGRAFPKLDEAKVWKIFVDLSNGLRFIHDAGVIHLDIKPANIFITSEGRFKIGDFGMASFWPRPSLTTGSERVDQDTAHPSLHLCLGESPFEREGDKLYLAPEVLQGRYGMAADVFSLGMTMLETASNIVVPDQGEAWHRLRQEDFSLVDMDCSPELLGLVRSMMRKDPEKRVSMQAVYDHPVVGRARKMMESMMSESLRGGGSVFNASPLGSVGEGFLEEILRRKGSDAMDVC